jgi:hypothetical protein
VCAPCAPPTSCVSLSAFAIAAGCATQILPTTSLSAPLLVLPSKPQQVAGNGSGPSSTAKDALSSGITPTRTAARFIGLAIRRRRRRRRRRRCHRSVPTRRMEAGTMATSSRALRPRQASAAVTVPRHMDASTGSSLRPIGSESVTCISWALPSFHRSRTRRSISAAQLLRRNVMGSPRTSRAR